MAQQASITFITPPQTKNPGESALFNCTVSKPKDVLVTWIKDGKTLTLGSLLAFPDPRLKIAVDDATNTYSLQVRNEI
jgi:hypothetical protein